MVVKQTVSSFSCIIVCGRIKVYLQCFKSFVILFTTGLHSYVAIILAINKVEDIKKHKQGTIYPLAVFKVLLASILLMTLISTSQSSQELNIPLQR